MRHLKRIRLSNETQMLSIPRYAPGPKDEVMSEPLDYLVFIYYTEERVLSDIIY
jgi:hypothetical protein